MGLLTRAWSLRLLILCSSRVSLGAKPLAIAAQSFEEFWAICLLHHRCARIGQLFENILG